MRVKLRGFEKTLDHPISCHEICTKLYKKISIKFGLI